MSTIYQGRIKWGQILGILSDQTDLQIELTALDTNKVNRVGDTMTGDLTMHADIILRSGQKLIFDG